MARNPAGGIDAALPPPETSKDSVQGLLAYEALRGQLSGLRSREQDYLDRFMEENPLVIRVREQIASMETRISAMLERNPGLVLGSVDAVTKGLVTESGVPIESAPALKARIKVLKEQLVNAREESLRLSDLEKQISEIQLSKEIQQENLRYLATSLEQSRYDTALGVGNNSNINVLQEPSRPKLDSERARKFAVLVFAGLTGSGLVLAFLLELVLDPRVKRASQLEEKTQLPVYVSIPNCRSFDTGTAYLAKDADCAPEALSHGGSEGLRPYYEALRDRLIVYFERVNLRRKPKLVGISSCHRHAGVSSVAEGLAATLSETGGGKVLLVDLNQGSESIHTFHRGRPVVELPKLLEQGACSGERDSGNTLFLASLGKSKGDYHPMRSREFDALIPQLKASDFDFIVFDMPPMTATGVTFRVAGFLDKMLLVTEAERTHLDSARQAIARLQESSAKLALVMNKTRDYVPAWLRPPQ